MAEWPDLSGLRRHSALLSQDSEAMEVQEVLKAVFRQAGNDLRGFTNLFGQVASRPLDASELQKRN